MSSKDPFGIIKSRLITEKTMMQAGLETSESNRCTRACQTPKAVFVVDDGSNKREIAAAVEEIYRSQKVKVTKVNTVRRKPKKRRVRGRPGFKSGRKLAIVSFEAGDKIDNA